MKKSILLFLTIFLFSCKKNSVNIHLEKGMVISESVTVFPDTFRINSGKKLQEPAISIKGKNIVVDFQGAVLKGSEEKIISEVVKIFGTGIHIEGENIEIKNVNVQGYRSNLMVHNSNNIKISNSSFNLNQRKALKRKMLGVNRNGHLADYSVKLMRSRNVMFKNNIVSQNASGIYLGVCENCIIKNNKITHNSRIGILISSSNNNKIFHNYLDWNISQFNKTKNPSRAGAGIVSVKSRNNTIAYNSISHSGKNKFEKNVVYQNNFFPFSKDSIYQNRITEKIPPLPDGQITTPKNYKYWGKQYILFNELGPYNFEYPAIWLREINEDKYTFAIFGPEGNWKIVYGNGFIQTSRQSGSLPATVVATKEKNADPKNLSLELEFIGVEFTDQFGNINPRGKTFTFDFQNDDEIVNNEQ